MQAAADKELPIEYLQECFTYNPNTGDLTWKLRPLKHFEHSSRADGGFNKKYAGKVAGSVMSRGYLWITLCGRPHFAHRIAWALHYGHYPLGQLDHSNGVRTDNRISNLIEVSARSNSRNRKTPVNNTSGHIGVTKRKNSFRAYINGSSGREWLGSFPTIEEAIIARKLAEEKYNYHENHGR